MSIPVEPLAVPGRVRELAGRASLEPVWRNDYGGLTFRTGDERYIKFGPRQDESTFAGEALRLEWAGRHARVPEVLDVGGDDGHEWLVTRALPGESAVAPRWIAEIILTSNAAFTPSETGPAESPRDTTPAPVAATSQSTVSAPAAPDTTMPTTGNLTATPGMVPEASSPSGESHTTTGTPLVVVESPEGVMLWIEAEEGLHSGLMEIGLDDNASSGRYLWIPTGQEVALDPSQSNSEVRYTFTVPTADLYVIWGHVRPSATGTGSFFIALDSEAPSSIRAGAGTVTDVVPQHYAVAPVQVGDTYYIDRTYSITAMPDELKGSLAIKTANNSKNSTEATLLTFTVTQDATLYVAYDARATRFPDWLTASFTKTGQVLQTTDTALMLWKREVAAGPVVLPGNQFGNPVGTRSHYVVFVATGASGQTATGPDYAIWTLPSNADLWMWDQAASDSSPVFFLEPGEYTLIIKQRESGSQLDQLLITNNIEYQP